MKYPLLSLSRGLIVSAVIALAVHAVAASEVKILRADNRGAFLAGELDRVSIDPLGVLALAEGLEPLAEVEEPFVFAAVAAGESWILGTGNSGRVLRVDREGQSEVLCELEEPEVFALWADPDGRLFAASSPGGKVYRLGPDGQAEAFFDPEETYIWALARHPDGDLLVATGLSGRLYKVDDQGHGRLLFDSGDAHLRSLAVLADGSVLAGTAGQGRVLRISADGGARTLLDAVEPEVLAFAARPEGGAYVAVTASEASFVDLSAKKEGEEGEGEAAVVADAMTLGSRGAGYAGPRSRVLEVSASGEVEEIARFQDETAHALLVHGGELWIGTGQEGKLYRYTDRLVLERDFEERQLIALAAGPRGVGVATTNAAGLYRLTGGSEAEGVYTSPVLDAGSVARFGSFRWHGDSPGKSSLELAFRSGISQVPDATWSPWRKASGDGPELSLGELPRGRYVQWRARLRGEGGEGPRLRGVELSYRQDNARPELVSFEVLDPGMVLVPTNFNPSNQTFEPWSPNREGIFTTLKVAPESDENRTKNLWKKGYRTLRWEASDPNGDTLRFRLGFRADGEEGAWLPIVEDLEESYFSFDSTVLPDGTYRFRVDAADRLPGAVEEALGDFEISSPVVIDHTPPAVVRKKMADGWLEVVVEDARSPLRDAVYSVDAGDWRSAKVADQLLDGRRETLRLEVGEERLLLLRLTDAAHNVVTFDLSTP